MFSRSILILCFCFFYFRPYTGHRPMYKYEIIGKLSRCEPLLLWLDGIQRKWWTIPPKNYFSGPSEYETKKKEISFHYIFVFVCVLLPSVFYLVCNAWKNQRKISVLFVESLHIMRTNIYFYHPKQLSFLATNSQSPLRFSSVEYSWNKFDLPNHSESSTEKRKSEREERKKNICYRKIFVQFD